MAGGRNKARKCECELTQRRAPGTPVVIPWSRLCFHGGGIQRSPRPKDGEREGHSRLMVISWKTLSKSLYLSYPWGRWNTPVPSGAKLMNTVHEWAQAEAGASRYLRLGDRSVTWNCRPRACGSNTFSREAKNQKKIYLLTFRIWQLSFVFFLILCLKIWQHTMLARPWGNRHSYYCGKIK